ncbi:hypothetical protein OG455_17020 [Kitasatospora sp. NBC_01287]|uniref:hypothetical protein n=1 Tax=Kitasatospora sp. NBC_01287 TaxID=2903573 RepID=UPI00225B9759|nr:hypothetical protein [Kitasatospora sp. NBC_01287]MCX4747200.1 hypothetical protein [Kitasatospora sp. NBC_01287]
MASAQFTLPANVAISPVSGQDLSALDALCAGNFPVPGSDDGAPSDQAFGPEVRQLFDHDFTHLAVVTSDAKTGASHVGYVDLAGKFTDLTGDSTGFTSTPAERDALFAPDGSSVWFSYRDAAGQQHIASRAVSGGHQITEQWTGAPGTLGNVTLALGGSPLHGVLGGDLSFSPDGKRVVGFVDGQGENVVNVAASGLLSTASAPAAIPDLDCRPVGWVDDHTILCGHSALGSVDSSGANYQNNIWTIDVDKMQPGAWDHAKDAASPPLLPVTDRKNLPVAISPDGKRVLFRSLQGSTEQPFVTDLTPGAQPQQITAPDAATALGTGDVVIDWR